MFGKTSFGFIDQRVRKWTGSLMAEVVFELWRSWPLLAGRGSVLGFSKISRSTIWSNIFFMFLIIWLWFIMSRNCFLSTSWQRWCTTLKISAYDLVAAHQAGFFFICRVCICVFQFEVKLYYDLLKIQLWRLGGGVEGYKTNIVGKLCIVRAFFFFSFTVKFCSCLFMPVNHTSSRLKKFTKKKKTFGYERLPLLKRH